MAIITRGDIVSSDIDDARRTRYAGCLENLNESGERCYSEDGVDLTMIRWMLSLTPAERLEVLESAVSSIL